MPHQLEAIYYALEVLAHLRDNKRITETEARRLCPGEYIQASDRSRVADVMAELGLLGSVTSTKGAQLTKNLFPELLTKIG
jgi:hypothetical protein